MSSLNSLGIKFLAIFFIFGLILSFQASARQALQDIHLNQINIDQKDLIALNNEFQKAQFPTANILVIKENVVVELNEDGTYKKTIHAIYKALTKEGVDELRSRYFPFHELNNRVQIVLARAVVSEGRIVNVPLTGISEVSSSNQTEKNIYDKHAKVKVVSFAELNPGSLIEFIVEEDCFNPLMANEFNAIEIFQDFYPLVSKSFSLLVKKGASLRYAARDADLNFVKLDQGDKTLYHWSVQNQPALHPEPAMPPLVNFAPRLIVSTIGSWNDISRWYYELIESRLKLNPDSVLQVKKITKDIKGRDEKIQAVYRFVSQKIRYLGLGTGVNKGYIPKPVSETLRSKFGICRDIAALMTAMLNAIGIEANVALTSFSYEMDKEIPTLFFNHAIVAVKNETKGFLFADPTIKNSRDLLISEEHDQDVLISTKKGMSLTRIPIKDSNQNKAEITANTDLSLEGGLKTTVYYKGTGIYDQFLRHLLFRYTIDQLKDQIQGFLRKSYPGVKLIEFEAGSVADYSNSMHLSYTFTISDYVSWTEDLVQFKPLLSNGNYDWLSDVLLSSATLERRKMRWNVGTTFSIHERESLTFPKGFSILSLPEEHSYSIESVFYNVKFKTKPQHSENVNGLSYSKKLNIEKKCLSIAEYDYMKQVLKVNDEFKKSEIILMKEM